MARILIVDDEQAVVQLLGHILKREGYDCTEAGSVDEAKHFLEKDSYELIVSDIMMPGGSGFDLVEYALETCPDTATIMLTGVDDSKVAKRAIDLGVYDYIIKPAQRNEVIISVINALRRRELEIASRTYREDLESKVAERTLQLQKSMQGIVEAMARTLEVRDPYTAGHQARVADLAWHIAGDLGMTRFQIDGIRMAGQIHDLGKISVPAEILSKPTRLTDMEFKLIQNHVATGYDILKDIEFPWPIARIVQQHHERLDGSGYLGGLSGDDIIMEARVLTVADVVEAMASHRPYRPALGIDKALEEIRKQRGTLFDEDVVDVCLNLFESGKYTM